MASDELRRKWFVFQRKHRRSDGRQRTLFKAQLKSKGMTRDEFDAMLTAQAGRCEHCRCPLLTGPQFHQHNDELCLDHDHHVVPVRVRALLCRRCNRNRVLDAPTPLKLPDAIRSRRQIGRYFDLPIAALLGVAARPR